MEAVSDTHLDVYKRQLFEGLYISKNKELCDEYMGKYPVIFLSLKGIDGLTFEEAIIRITTIIKNEAPVSYTHLR